MRRALGPLLLTVLLTAACGGFGGSSGGGSRKPTKTPDPNATRTSTGTPKQTRTPTKTGGPTYTPRPTKTPGPPVTLYVRESGDDENSGMSPDQALHSLAVAVKRLSPGSTLYVGAGVYSERLTVSNIAGTAELPVQILADRTGAATGDAGSVFIDGAGALVAAILTNSPYVTLDGFILHGVAPTDTATAVTLRVRGRSDHVTISNCVVANAQPADGIRVDSSSDVLLFNNLVFAADRGVVITGTANGIALVNDTVAFSTRAALSLRPSGGSAPENVTATNCIFQENGTGAAIDAGSAPQGYSGDYNLVYQPDAEDQSTAYNPSMLRGDHDQNVDALFVNIEVGDIHLQPGSPAIDAGSDRIDEALKTELEAGSTVANGTRDRLPLDLGYHYPR